MPIPDLVIRGQRVILPASRDQDVDAGLSQPQERREQFLAVAASIHIQDGIITQISGYDDVPAGSAIEEVDNESTVMPGLVDTHVHINEPGRTDWEGFASATRAAAAGGVTTLVDMPLNSIPPTTTTAALLAKIEAARGQCSVDVAFWGGVVPGNTSALTPLYDIGVVGFKCFLVPSGVDEFPNVTKANLHEAMPELARLGAVLIVHAELPGPIDAACCSPSPPQEGSRYETFLQARPRAAENEAVALMIALSREFGTQVHIVHHSSSDALPMLREAKAIGVKITAETCPHYLYFAAEEIPDGATEFKCCPPIRERDNRERLWQALADRTIDMVVSDHSPCPPGMKCRDEGDFMKAWGGISSLQLRLPVMWTEARRRGYSISRLSEWLCSAPARLAGLGGRKGKLAVGYDADVVVWNPEKKFSVVPEMIQHRHRLTPYAGRQVSGMVQTTFLRGEKVYDGGVFKELPRGRLLRRQAGVF
ncbi:MAG TPA: allantoinase AllB [Pyrinomonadaceae bacterium]|nr:allantoinase AllB [Pyrinomonadaceae bacterium]